MFFDFYVSSIEPLVFCRNQKLVGIFSKMLFDQESNETFKRLKKYLWKIRIWTCCKMKKITLSNFFLFLMLSTQPPASNLLPMPVFDILQWYYKYIVAIRNIVSRNLWWILMGISILKFRILVHRFLIHCNGRPTTIINKGRASDISRYKM